MKKSLSWFCLAVGLALIGLAAPRAAVGGEPSVDELAAGFRSPPDSAKPLTFWHWMNGCVSKAGITADLESFKSVGLGGTQQFLVGGNSVLVDDPSVALLNPKWRELMRFAADESTRLGLSFGTHNSPGWSSSGGPQVKVEQSMQKIVWTSRQWEGPGEFNGKLRQPEVDPQWDYYQDIAVLAVPDGTLAPRERTIDLTAQMQPDGQLHWNAPEGEWSILRFGHTTTGKMNSPAPASGQGLECDKMSRAALDAFWAGYPSQMLAEIGANVGKSFQRIEIDSYEAGEQNWTPAMREEFTKRRGYDPIPWLPALAKRIVDSPEMTARFLYDWRRTIAALFNENYYGYMAELVHKHPGLQLLIEPYATGKVEPFDLPTVSGRGDLLACEFWQKPATWGWDSVGPVASAAHTWGKNLVMAEAYTGQPQYAWQVDPAALKSTGDRAFCAGVNQMVLHTSAHQPWPGAAPGMTMDWWGTQFGPTQTWWNDGGKAWIEYLTRCQYLLQQGKPVVDLCYLVRGKLTPRNPVGYDGDTCGEEELLTRMSVRDGRLVLPDGMSYRALVIPAGQTMLPVVARKIRQLVQDGAVVISAKPTRSPSLENYPSCDAEVARLGGEVWGDGDGISVKEHTFGKGKIFWSVLPQDVLAQIGTEPDLRFEPLNADRTAPLQWIHRRVGSAEVYFFSNQKDEPVKVEVSFRASGMAPELWRADSGKMEAAPAWTAREGRTAMPMELEASGSVFVVFRPLAAGVTTPQEAKASDKAAAATSVAVEGPWQVSFPPGQGAPERVVLDKLISWPQSADAGLKYFSGTAKYAKELEIPEGFVAAGRTYWLDLGKVKNVATVRLNGKELGVLWKPPFRVELGDALKPGKNALEVRVTNLWVNRLVGDAQEPDDCEWGPERTFQLGKQELVIGKPLAKVPAWLTEGKPKPSKGRYAFTTFDFFKKDTPLLESGLVGPVKMEAWAAEKTAAGK